MGQKLGFVSDDDVFVPGDLIAGEKIILWGYDIGLPEQTYSALDDVGPVPVVDAGFNEPDGHPPLLVVKLGDEGLSGFGAAHCAVFEVKLCHSDLSCLVDGVRRSLCISWPMIAYSAGDCNFLFWVCRRFFLVISLKNRRKWKSPLEGCDE